MEDTHRLSRVARKAITDATAANDDLPKLVNPHYKDNTANHISIDIANKFLLCSSPQLPLSYDDKENTVFDDDDPPHSLTNENTSHIAGDFCSITTVNSTSHHQPSDDEYENFTFDDDNPSTSSPCSFTDDDYNHNYDSEELEWRNRKRNCSIRQFIIIGTPKSST